jgi:small subunit ribosomal protein S2
LSGVGLLINAERFFFAKDFFIILFYFYDMSKTQEHIDMMFKAGAHYGYSKTRRHPSTASHIFTTKNKNDIIDLEKTAVSFESVLEFLAELGKGQKTVLFVGAKPEAKKKVVETATALDMPYVVERWIGGTITNFVEIKKRIATLEELRDKREKGELDMYTKKERLLIDQKIEKLTKYFGGLVHLKKAPDALFIIDAKREHIALTEAQSAGIPIIALANTDTNIKGIEFPIVANDGSQSSIAFFLEQAKVAYESGKITKA